MFELLDNLSSANHTSLEASNNFDIMSQRYIKVTIINLNPMRRLNRRPASESSQRVFCERILEIDLASKVTRPICVARLGIRVW
jgi:hypothetical protein